MSVVRLDFQLESTSDAPSAKALGKLSGKLAALFFLILFRWQGQQHIFRQQNPLHSWKDTLTQ